MRTLAKLQPLIIIATSTLGILLGLNPIIAEFSGSLIEPSLMILLFVVFLSIDLSGLKGAIKNIKLTGISLAINFIWTPLFAMILAKAFLGASIDLQIGFVMLLVTPCTDWYLVFTKMARGNVEAGAALLPVNLVLQVMLLPVYLFLFLGDSIAFDPMVVLSSIAFVLVIPFACATVIKLVFNGLGKKRFLSDSLERRGDAFQLVFLCIAICAMFASQSDLVLTNPWVFLLLLLPLMIFFITNYLLAAGVGRIAKFSYENTTALTFTTLARNSPLSLAIAISAFAHQPMIGLALVIGPLIELPVLALVSSLLKRRHATKNEV